MSNTNIAIIGQGTIFDVNAKLEFLYINQENIVYALLDSKNININKILSHKDLNVDQITSQLSFFKQPDLIFEISVLYKKDFIALNICFKKILNDCEIFCNIFKIDNQMQLALSVEKDFFINGNEIEKNVFQVMEFLSVETVTVIVRNDKLKDNAKNYFKTVSEGRLPQRLIDSEDKFIAYADFNLKDSPEGFAQDLYDLTKFEKIGLKISGSDSSISALLYFEDIISENYSIKMLELGIETPVGLKASGDLFLKIKDKQNGNQEKNLAFKIAGTLGLHGLTLSASTLDTDSSIKFALNSKYGFSQLSLILGVSGGGPLIGMTGRLQVGNLTFFGGIIVREFDIPLVTCSLSAKNGSLSLKDIIVEIVEIEFPISIDFLDVVAVGDFELKNSKSSSEENCFISNWKNKPDSEELLTSFNETLPEDFHIDKVNQLEITPIYKDKSNSASEIEYSIITDSSKMRHFSISNDGKISLNCQIYFCYETFKIGNYDLQVGTFFCGSLRIFNVTAKVLLLIEPFNSATAIVQLSKIEYGGIFVLSASKAKYPTNIKEVGNDLSKTLLGNQNDQEGVAGPTLYFNINKKQSNLELYISAYIELFKIFSFDILVIIDARRYVSARVERNILGFNSIFSLEANYQDFSDFKFSSYIHFDTHGFLNSVAEANNKIKSVAKQIHNDFENAQGSVRKAKEDIENIKKIENEYRAEISKLSDKIDFWWHPIDSSGYVAQIAGYEALILGLDVGYVAAYAALSTAEATLQLGDICSGAVLESVSVILSSVTEFLFLESFSLQLNVNSTDTKIEADIKFKILGKDVHPDPFLLNIDGVKDYAQFFTDSMNTRLEELTDNCIKKLKDTKTESKLSNGINCFQLNGAGKVSLAVRLRGFDILTSLLKLLKNGDLKEKILHFNSLADFHTILENFIEYVSKAYLESYGKLDPRWQTSICKFSESLSKNQAIVKQRLGFLFDANFTRSLRDISENLQNNLVKNYGISESALEEPLRYINGIIAEMATLQNNSNFKDIKLSNSLFERVEQQVKDFQKKQDSMNCQYSEHTNSNSQNDIFLAKLIDYKDKYIFSNENPVMKNLNTYIDQFITDLQRSDIS